MAQRTEHPKLPGLSYLASLGSGGFADVFRYQERGRTVAVKVLRDRAADTFEAEVNLMAKLSSHPYIVSILWSGVAPDGRPFLVMEECETAHLGAKIAKRLQTVSKAMEITIQVAGAVETAHRMGILHRDIKPANILFTKFGRPALTDFGISVGAEVQTAQNALSWLWAPQEQHPDSGLEMGPWSDVFSLAATMWAMLVGRSPLEEPGGANGHLNLRHRARTFVPSATGRQDTLEVLERVLATALARDPQQRYPSALEFARALQGVQGQMNASVTPIDVLSEQVEEDLDDRTELSDSGTRVSGFLLIDPDQVDDHTAASTGPSSGVISPFDRSERQAIGLPPAQVTWHGRGVATPGLRDFTGPAVPEFDGRAAREGAGLSARTQDSVGRGRKLRGPLVGVLVGLVALAVLMVGAIASGLLGGWSPESETQPTMAGSPRPQDPLPLRVPPVEDLKGVVTDQNVTFTWTNPDPLEGDTYMFEELSLPEQQPVDLVDEATVTVSVQPGQTCINVSLRRGNGKVSSPVRGCVES